VLNDIPLMATNFLTIFFQSIILFLIISERNKADN